LACLLLSDLDARLAAAVVILSSRSVSRDTVGGVVQPTVRATRAVFKLLAVAIDPVRGTIQAAICPIVGIITIPSAVVAIARTRSPVVTITVGTIARSATAPLVIWEPLQIIVWIGIDATADRRNRAARAVAVSIIPIIATIAISIGAVRGSVQATIFAIDIWIRTIEGKTAAIVDAPAATIHGAFAASDPVVSVVQSAIVAVKAILVTIAIAIDAVGSPVPLAVCFEPVCVSPHNSIAVARDAAIGGTCQATTRDVGIAIRFAV
jgi:hypothetical protein